MSLTLKVKRGYTCVQGIPIDNAALNAGFLPIVTLEGTVSPTDLVPGVVHKEQVTPDAYWYADDSDAGANALVATYTPAPEALEDGLLLACKVQTANAGPVTFNPNGLGAKPLYKYHDVALAAGDLDDNMIIEMRYDTEGNGGGGAWQLLTPVATILDNTKATAIVTVGGGGDIAVPLPGAVATIAHGLGKVPAWVRVVAVNVTPVDGYLAGDELDISCLTADLAGSGTYQDNDQAAYAICADATNVTVAAANPSQGIMYIAKGGGVLETPNGFVPTKWKLKVYLLSI